MFLTSSSIDCIQPAPQELHITYELKWKMKSILNESCNPFMVVAWCSNLRRTIYVQVEWEAQWLLMMSTLGIDREEGGTCAVSLLTMTNWLGSTLFKRAFKSFHDVATPSSLVSSSTISCLICEAPVSRKYLLLPRCVILLHCSVNLLLLFPSLTRSLSGQLYSLTVAQHGHLLS